MTNATDSAFPNKHLAVIESGLSKREYFAAMAMQGLLANPSYSDYSNVSLSASSVEFADALIEQLNNNQ